ncbi:helix-turn-helix domain-containing protein [Salinimonas lutimaris]|uniref:helix-turn-helix domain-containing protein n=1 Tax=Salinimonas lutimaris TaxID=914153 RepID=UPI0010C151C7|nr:helix-turn-helix domain-containing protein [Salinimonas lutimaris]
MQYKGLFWSAIVRSLLSLRRDSGLHNAVDSRALEMLHQLESGLFQDGDLHTLLAELIPVHQRISIGKSLIGYIDFNKMGNLVMFATAVKNIDSALATLQPRSSEIFSQQLSQHTSEAPLCTVLSWQGSASALADDLQVYFLFALFRHLAGRQFDFTRAELPLAEASLLSSLSSAPIRHADNIQLAFEKKWGNQLSFYHSQAIEKLLAPTLSKTTGPGLKESIQAIFDRAEAPARIRAEWVAEQMGQTESGFRRTLKNHDIAFSAVLKEYIHDKSCQKLISGNKTDDTASELGFSDRRSFERSFKEFTGISAGQLRQLGNRLRFQKGNGSLLDIVDNLPPLPETIQALLNIEDDKLTLDTVVELVTRDPIFQAHIMSKASKAVFGSTPTNLEQAIGRNLGLSNIKHLAVLFAAQQQLNAQCRHADVEKLTDAMLLSHELYNRLFGFEQVNAEQKEIIRQLLLFGTLSSFLFFHEECLFVDGILTFWDDASSLLAFTQRISDEFGLCLYGSTSLMLLRWGFKNTINQQLWKLCQAQECVGVETIASRVILSQNLAYTTVALPHGDVDRELAALPAELATQATALLEKW